MLFIGNAQVNGQNKGGKIDQNRVSLSRYLPLSALPLTLYGKSAVKFLATSIQNANLARAEARAVLRVIDCLIFLWEYRLDAGGFKSFPTPSGY